jgi:hypothetical protein
MSFIPIEDRSEILNKVNNFFAPPSVDPLESHGCEESGHRGSFVHKDPCLEQGLTKGPWAISIKIFRIQVDAISAQELWTSHGLFQHNPRAH